MRGRRKLENCLKSKQQATLLSLVPLGFFLGSGLSREFFLATVLLHLHCLLFGVLGWVSVQHFVTSAEGKYI
jgi:positive regulator of sigma E activity